MGFIEPHGYLDENLNKQSLDAVITPTKNLEYLFRNYKFGLLSSVSQKCFLVSPEGSSSYKEGLLISGDPSLLNWYLQSHFLSVKEI